MTTSVKPEVHNAAAVKGEPSHGHWHHAQKIGKIRPDRFRVMHADRQTDRH